VPLVDERWTAVSAEVARIPIVDAGSVLPAGAETGIRWGHVGAGVACSISFSNGFNHLPNIDVITAGSPSIVISRTYPSIQTYGADAAVPTRWFMIKREAAYLTSSSTDTDEYVLYVLQIERQTAEWVLVGGYAGEAVTAHRAALSFAPDRGMARSLVARGSYTIDSNRSLALETAVRQNGDGVSAKAGYSQALGQHWRAIVAGAAISGHSDDFLGQYRRNSHVAATLRYSF
jgi:hypothetical protein